jgi:CorA-like Mg2+ transporter protein
LVWLDTGRDLTRGPEGPWLEPADRDATWPSTSFYPTIQNQPQISLKPHRTVVPQSERPGSRFAQSASLLPLDYGKLLDPALMASDPFYAMNDLFKFVAYSEIQFLNMIEAKVAEETGHLSLAKQSQLSNLLNSHDVLESHARRLRSNIETIKFRGSPDWPKATDTALLRKAEAAAQSLLRDYEHLLSRTESLSARCQRGMNVMMNKAVITESKRAVSQAQEVTKLTRLAFIYIPLSFTASFFGMNLKPIESGTYGLWLWVVVSVLAMVFSLCALVWDASEILRRANVCMISFRKVAQYFSRSSDT